MPSAGLWNGVGLGGGGEQYDDSRGDGGGGIRVTGALAARIGTACPLTRTTVAVIRIAHAAVSGTRIDGRARGGTRSSWERRTWFSVSSCWIFSCAQASSSRNGEPCMRLSVARRSDRAHGAPAVYARSMAATKKRTGSPPAAPPDEKEPDGGYEGSHGYGEGHGGPSGPGDAPAPTDAPQTHLPKVDDDEVDP